MVVMYEKGQIVIPKWIRDMLKLRPGNHLSVTVEKNKLVLTPANTWLEELDQIRAECATLTQKEVEEGIKRAEKKRRDGCKENVY